MTQADLNRAQRRKRRKQILFTSLGLSFISHLVILFIIYSNPLWLSSPPRSRFSRSALSHSFEEELNLLERDHVLEEVFALLVARPSPLKEAFDSDWVALDVQTYPLAEEVTQDFVGSSLTPPFLEENTLALHSIDHPLHEDEERAPLLEEDYVLSPAPLFSAIPKDKRALSGYVLPLLLSEPFEEESPPLSSLARATQEPVDLSEMEEAMSEVPLTHASVPRELDERLRAKEPLMHSLMAFKSFGEPLVRELDIKREPILSRLKEYDFPNVSPTTSWNDHFTVDVQVAPHPEGEGYIFSLVLTPLGDLSAMQLKQNVYFVIDRSNSIERTRYENFKRATLRALNFLREGDLFNIIIFDRKIHRLSDKNLPVTKRSIEVAEQFLKKKEYQAAFAATEVYSTLKKILPSSLPEDELHTLFLLSDGNTLLDLKKQRKAILQWTQQNSGKVSLYAATAGGDNHLTLLDLLSRCNRGELIYSRTHAAFPRRLAKAVATLHLPLAKELSFQAVPAEAGHQIQLYPPSYRAPALYARQPYVIVGKSDQLKDFTLFVEGLNRGEPITIRKEISFAHAKKARILLEKRWALQEVQTNYENFLKDGKGIHLIKAEEKLNAYGGELAFK
jgi:hypothetical protein